MLPSFVPICLEGYAQDTKPKKMGVELEQNFAVDSSNNIT
jgi:hypothetical protein